MFLSREIYGYDEVKYPDVLQEEIGMQLNREIINTMAEA